MRGTVAKRIRRRIYGDMSIRKREYRQTKEHKVNFHSFINGVKTLMASAFLWTQEADPLRRAYQRAKKDYLRGRRCRA